MNSRGYINKHVALERTINPLPLCATCNAQTRSCRLELSETHGAPHIHQIAAATDQFNPVKPSPPQGVGRDQHGTDSLGTLGRV